MAEYTLKVTTGSMLYAGTFDNLYVTLIGTERQSERTQLMSLGLDDTNGKVGTFAVTTLFTLGCLLFLKMEKDPLEKDWFCSTIVVTTPEGDEMIFPCHRWLSKGDIVLLRGGRATKAFEDLHPKLVDQRKKELVQQKIIYKWALYAEGLPYMVDIKDENALPAESTFSFSRAFELQNTIKEIYAEFELKGLTDLNQQFESFEALKMASLVKKTPLAEYVSEHWKDDDFFGYQFLNGINPFIIQRCSKLPSNFPLTEEMVQPFLAIGSSLNAEMKKGNIFLSDYKIMEGLATKVIDGKPTVVTPALCLLYLNPQKKLLPIAIQLSQQPSEENPIFLPTDSESDWMLAKMFVRSADALHHLLVSHLLRTHLLPEVFTMATLRNLPKNHPLHKLLTPHHRFTIPINIFAREILFGPGQFFSKSSLDEEGQLELMRRGLSRTTYSSLCLPENIAARGLESIPNFHFRDDALRLWSIINSFIQSMVAYYYPSDSEVSADSELQEWINEIFYHGFLGNYDSGFPSSLQTVEELIQVVTTVVFTSSASHSAGNRGQFDHLGWIPNGPLILNKAPQTTKEQSSMEDILAYLPKKSSAILVMLYTWPLRGNFSDFEPLGTYPEQRFAEPAALQMIEDFQAELSSLSMAITERNSKLELPFNYLNPKEIENSPGI
ncbi:polyunsaturated fatty acid lipoxygenase ALOX15B-like [Pseudochaenichthys georgianus]|uniref:polyunsaturated fatty acid lipoxygenase ALOX15B-like n=1 Tax=Pseudochaenichthys georgianus TaxID=52239 RepID=UPI00146A319C|nr:arachidonate 15-lipoxygenase B-like [Pseudochaenichthys georgianus]